MTFSCLIDPFGYDYAIVVEQETTITNPFFFFSFLAIEFNLINKSFVILILRTFNKFLHFVSILFHEIS